MTDSDDVEQLLNREDKREAVDWLTSAPPGVDRGIGELDNAESLAFVRKLYRRGAREIAVVDLSETPDGTQEWTDKLILALPTDLTKRQSVLRLANRPVIEMGFEPETDHGQRHLVIWLD